MRTQNWLRPERHVIAPSLADVAHPRSFQSSRPGLRKQHRRSRTATRARRKHPRPGGRPESNLHSVDRGVHPGNLTRRAAFVRSRSKPFGLETPLPLAPATSPPQLGFW